MHEIVTVQIGQQANFLGTHFWNTQESYFTYDADEESPVNHDINFRPGRGSDGSDTFTPRTVIYDFKANFGTLKRLNELYDVSEDQRGAGGTWYGGRSVTQRQPQLPQNDFLRSLNDGGTSARLSTSSIQFWSDFNRVYYHPRSLVQIYETDLGLEQRAFNSWQHGEELFQALDRQEELVDRDVRPFVEECDQMQGIQLITSVGDGWSGFSNKYLDRLRDDFGKIPIWTWALDSPKGALKKPGLDRQQINAARCLVEMSSQSSLYVPLTDRPSSLPPAISLVPQSTWQTSALLATAFETVTLPSRLKANSASTTYSSLDTMSSALERGLSRRVAELSFAVAGSQIPSMDPSDAVCRLFPGFDRALADEATKYARIEVRRGDVFEDTVHENGARQEVPEERYQSSLTFPILDTFPPIFKETDDSGISVHAELGTSKAVAFWAQKLESQTKWLVGREDREDFCNGLHQIREAYVPDYDSLDEEWDD